MEELKNHLQNGCRTIPTEIVFNDFLFVFFALQSNTKNLKNPGLLIKKKKVFLRLKKFLLPKVLFKSLTNIAPISKARQHPILNLSTRNKWISKTTEFIKGKLKILVTFWGNLFLIDITYKLTQPFVTIKELSKDQLFG